MAGIPVYARESTTDKDPDGQRHRRTDSGATPIFDDVISGHTFERPGLASAVDYARRCFAVCYNVGRARWSGMGSEEALSRDGVICRLGRRTYTLTKNESITRRG
jgi:Resolvase, N terminal domain